MNRANLQTLAHILTFVLMPVFFGFSTITCLVSPAYPQFEYNLADFPLDKHGLTSQERLDLALVGVAYLRSYQPADEVIYMLQEQVLPGTAQPLYSASELQHMIDVKNLTDSIRLGSWVSGLILAISLFMLLKRPETRPKGCRAVMQGGLITMILLSTLAAFVLFGWPIFFRTFHEVLFPPDTWTFASNSGLIRLFPERFWFDFGLLATTAVTIEGMGAALLGFLLVKKAKPGL